MQAITAPAAIVFDALSFLASAFFLARIGHAEAPADEGHRPTLLHDLRVGLGASVFHPLVRPEFLVEANSAIWGGFFAALLRSTRWRHCTWARAPSAW